VHFNSYDVFYSLDSHQHVSAAITAIFDIFDIYLFTAIGLTPGGRSTVHIYTQTIHRTIQNKQYTEQHNNLSGRVRVVPCLG